VRKNTDLKFSTVCEKMSENRRSQGADFLTHSVQPGISKAALSELVKMVVTHGEGYI